MGSRGRKSAASNVVALDVTGAPSQLTPPSHLSKSERALFNELVGSCDQRHFVKSDLPLLTSYVQASLLARSGPGTNPDTVAAWAGSVRVQALLATRLRLAPQARSDPRTIGVRQRNAAEHRGPPPWARERGDDH